MYPQIPHFRRGCLNSLPEKSAKLSNYVLEIGTSIFLTVCADQKSRFLYKYLNASKAEHAVQSYVASND